MTIIDTKYPKTLYVTSDDYYPYHGIKQLIGRETLESSVRDDDKENEVAVYQLVGVNKYKKKVTRTSVVEKVDDASNNS